MRFNHEVPPLPVKGDKRTFSWFAFKPVRIDFQTRWLERVFVEQEYRKVPHFVGPPGMPRNVFVLEWVNERFFDPDECPKSMPRPK